MEINNIEEKIIKSIHSNILESGSTPPQLSSKTEIFTDIEGFDSLRAIEVLIDLEQVFGCELPIEKVFVKIPPKSEKIEDIANMIHKILV